MSDDPSCAGASQSGSPSSAKAPEAPTLQWLLDPIGRDEFFSEHWERRPLVVRRHQPEYFADLLSLKEVDRALTTLGRQYPEVVLKNAAKDVTAEDYTTDGRTLDVARVAQLFAEGCTITLAYLDTVLPQLTRICRRLESEFSCPFQTNVYVTPPGAQGARPHYDTHDVFVLQVAGSKKWTIFDRPVELPLAGQDFDPAKHPVGAPTMEFTLCAGDVAYVPRGVAHEAKSTDEVSLHITAGVLRYTWAQLLLEVVAGAALSDPALRRALPPDFARPSFDRAGARETLDALLKRVSVHGNFDACVDHFVDDFLVSCPPLLEGHLSQIAVLERLTRDTIVGVRDAIVFRVEQANGSLVVRCADRRISFPAHAAEAVCFALGQPRFPIREFPASLEDESKITLARRMVREGLLRVIEL